ncbi:MAG: phage tail protein [Bacteroidota bacterium]
MAASFPIPTYNYRVRIANRTISFSEVSGLAVQHDEVIYRHGLSESKGFLVQRGFSKPINLTLKKGMIATSDQSEDDLSRFLFKALEDRKKFDLDIDLCDEQGTALITWKVVGALPLKYEFPGLQASANDVAIESIDLVARIVLLGT